MIPALFDTVNISPKVQACIERLSSFFPSQAIEAAEILGEIKDLASVPALINALGHEDNGVRNAAFHSLIKFGDAAVSQLKDALLNHPFNTVQAYMVGHVLQQIGSEEAFLGLLDVGKHANGELLKACVYYLGMFEDERALPVIKMILKDEDSVTRSVAVGAVGQIPTPESIHLLLDALQDSDRDVRNIAVGSLGMIGDSEIIPSLIDMVNDPELPVQIASVHAIGRIGDPIAVQALLNIFETSDGVIRKTVVDLLKEIGFNES